MSFFKNKTKKIEITKKEISSVLSEVFHFVYKSDLVKHRDKIFQLVDEIYQKIDHLYGHAQNTEILLEDYYKIIHSSLSNNSGILGHGFEEVVLKNLKQKRQHKVNWNIKLELKESISINNQTYETIQLVVSQEQWMQFFEKIALYYINQSNYHFFFDVFKNAMLKIERSMTLTSEEWFDFFCKEIKKLQNKDPRIVYFLQALHIRKKLGALIGIDWNQDLKIVGEHKERNIFMFDSKNEKQDFLLESEHSKDHLFKLMTKEYLLSFFNEDELKKINLNILSEKANLKREYLITYLAEHYFLKNDALLKIDGKEWISDVDLKGFKSYLTYEPIQWLFLRSAIKLALNIFKEDKNITEHALSIYNHLSELNLILPLSIYRELNKSYDFNQLNFLKNFSVSVEDNYDEIHKVISDTISTTKWTGSVFLDFSKIRKQGTPVRNGLRISNGKRPYIETLNSVIKSQGREKDDFPISVSLPIYSYEISSLFLDKEEINEIKELKQFQKLKKRKNNNLMYEPFKDFKDLNTEKNTNIQNDNFSSNALNLIEQSIQIENEKVNKIIKYDYLNRVVIVNDDFMWKVFGQDLEQEWYLLDEHYFSSLNLDLSKREDYYKAVDLVKNKEVKNQYFKIVSAKKLFNSILKQSHYNNISLVFEDVYKISKFYNDKKLIYTNSTSSPLIENGKQGYLNFAICIDVETNKLKNILFYYFSIANLFKQNKLDPILSLLGLENLKEETKRNDLIKLFSYFEELKKHTLFSKRNFKETFNDYVEVFNKHRKNTQYLIKMREQINELLVFDHDLINNSVSLNDVEELSFVANKMPSYLGFKKHLVEIYENGKIETYHSPSFILHYHQNIVEHDIFEKIFMKQSYSYMEYNKQIFNVFYPSVEYLNTQLDFFNHFMPFFKKGIGVNLSRHLDDNTLFIMIQNIWFHGISNINIKH